MAKWGKNSHIGTNIKKKKKWFFTIKYHILFTEQCLWVYNHICSWTRVSQNVETSGKCSRMPLKCCNHETKRVLWIVPEASSACWMVCWFIPHSHNAVPHLKAGTIIRHSCLTKDSVPIHKKHVCLPPKIPQSWVSSRPDVRLTNFTQQHIQTCKQNISDLHANVETGMVSAAVYCGNFTQDHVWGH